MMQQSCRDRECVRRLIGLVVIGALVCGAAAQAEWGKSSPLQGERAAGDDASRSSTSRSSASRSSASRASRRVQPAAPVALGDGFVEFAATAKVVLHAQGGVAGPPPAVVYSNTIYGNGLFDPDGDLGSGIFFVPSRDDAISQGGWWLADDWVLQIGTGMSECVGTTLQIAIFGGGRRCFGTPDWNLCSVDSDCSDNNCQDAGPFDATVDVFNHDPSFANDDLMGANNTCLATDPGVGAHSTTFTGLDGLEIHVLEIDLGNTAIGGANGAIWVRVQTTTGSSGWVLGSNGDTAAPMPPDDAEIGFSADLIVLNDPSDGTCTAYAFGTPQGSMWGNLLCESAVAMSLQPAFATGVECLGGAADDPASCDWYIDGPGSITLHRPGQDISSEVFVSDWDQGGVSGLLVGAYQSGVDCATFSSGQVGTFRPPPSVSCQGDFTQVCNGIDVDRPDFLFSGLNIIAPCVTELCADGLPGFILCGMVTIVDGDGVPDPGMPLYANTYAFIDEDDNARGRFFLGITPDPNYTFLRDSVAQLIAPIARIPMRVVVQTGMCCGTPANSFCENDVLFDECQAMGGNFQVGVVCSGVDVDPQDGIDDACCGCDGDPNNNGEECDDGNACTVDDCQDCDCFNTDVTTPGFCCNPAGGAEMQIDDGNDCTIDECNPVTGQVSHIFSSRGSPCDDGEFCTSDDQCDGMGSCAGTPGLCPPIARPNPDPEIGLGGVGGSIVQPCDTAADCSDAGFGTLPNVDCVPQPDGTFPGTCYVSASRYLSIAPNPENAGASAARRISMDRKTCAIANTVCGSSLDCPFTCLVVGNPCNDINDCDDIPNNVCRPSEACSGNDAYDPGVDYVIGWVGEPFATVVTGPEPGPQAQAPVSPDPVYRDWNDLTDIDALLTGAVPVKVGDCQIAPKGASPDDIGNVYFIQSILQGDDESDERSYSAPLRLRTVVRQADVGGTGLGSNYPNSGINLADAFSILFGFQGLQTIPKWRLELDGGQTSDNVPDFQVINLLDVLRALPAFQTGGEYPFEQPCDCPGQGCP